MKTLHTVTPEPPLIDYLQLLYPSYEWTQTTVGIFYRGTHRATKKLTKDYEPDYQRWLAAGAPNSYRSAWALYRGL